MKENNLQTLITDYDKGVQVNILLPLMDKSNTRVIISTLNSCNKKRPGTNRAVALVKKGYSLPLPHWLRSVTV